MPGRNAAVEEHRSDSPVLDGEAAQYFLLRESGGRGGGGNARDASIRLAHLALACSDVFDNSFLAQRHPGFEVQRQR